MKFPSFGFRGEKGPEPLSAEEIEKSIKYGFINEGDEALAQKHPDFYRTLIADKERSIQGSAEEVVSAPTVSGEENESEVTPEPKVINVDEVLEADKPEPKDEEPVAATESAPAKSEPILKRKRFGWLFDKREKQKVEDNSLTPDEIERLRAVGYSQHAIDQVKDNPEMARSYLEKHEAESSAESPEEVPVEVGGVEVSPGAEEKKAEEEPVQEEEKKDDLPAPEEIQEPATPLTEEELEMFRERRGEVKKDKPYHSEEYINWLKENPEEGRRALDVLEGRSVSPRKTETTKEWEEMSEEEKKEKYGRSYEMREKIHEVRKSRTNLVMLESELNKRKSLTGRAKAFLTSDTSISIKDLEAKHEAAKERYKEARAEYVGAKTWRFLKEKQRVAEEGVRKHEGKYEKVFLEKWRKLGEKNLLTLIGKENWNPTSKGGKAAKFLARGLSARAAISLGLLTGGLFVGAGSAIGIGAFMTRRALSGVSSTVGTYDLLNLIGEKRDAKKTKELLENIDEVSVEEIEERMADIEARAKFAGERVVHTDEYEKLRKEYLKRIDNSSDREEAIRRAVAASDIQVQEAKQYMQEADTVKKFAAGVVGTVVSTGALAEALKYIKTLPGGADVTIDEVEKAVRGPALPADTAQVIVDQESVLPDTTLAAADTVHVSQEIEGLEGGNIEASLTREAVEIKSEHVGIVKQGGSAWQAGRDLVRSGALRQEEFARAWSNPASIVRLPSGQSIHISELGLVHAGDQVVYVPEANGVPAHFQVIDYAGDNLRVGSNQDLARAFDAAGKPRPAWLERALGAVQEPAGDTATEAVSTPVAPSAGAELPNIEPDLNLAGVDAVVDTTQVATEGVDNSTPEGKVHTLEELQPQTAEQIPSPEVQTGTDVTNQEIINNAAENVYEPREVASFSWGGKLNLVYNAEGRIDGYIIDTDNVPNQVRAQAVERAVASNFNNYYQEVLNGGARDTLRTVLGEGVALENGVSEVMPDVTAEANELAFRLDALSQAFRTATPNTPEWTYLRDELRREIRPDPNNPAFLRLGGVRVSSGIIKPELTRMIQ